MQRAVLEAVIEQMKARTKELLRINAGMVAIFADNNRNTEGARDQQRLVSELFHRTARLDQQNSFAGASVTAREHVKLHPARLQQLTQRNYKGRLAGAASG